MEDGTAGRLRVVVGRLTRLLRATEAVIDAGLTPTKTAVLMHVVRGQRVRLADVAEEHGMNPTLLSRAVAKLAEDGLVKRTPDPDDRRAGWLEPTAAGIRLAERIRKQRTTTVEAGLSRVSGDDRATLEAALPALERLAEALRR
jgi:DNA-binding MarR family transcriptional regulator